MRQVLIALLVLAVPRVALACPVCFGQSDAPMAIATNLGIMFMLGIVVAVLAAFASFFIYLMRRARLVAMDVPNPANAVPGPAEAGDYLQGRKGTAQC
jgi:Na+-transporting NADH:ubiquinone oxidoreductase subunit NqrD